MAAERRYVDIVRLLIDKVADVNVKDDDGVSKQEYSVSIYQYSCLEHVGV